MKNPLLSFLMSIIPLTTFGQTYLVLKNSSFESLKSTGVQVVDNTPIKIGASVGYNFGLNRLYDVAVNPTNNNIEFEIIGNTSVVLSTAIMVSPKVYRLRQMTNAGGAKNSGNTQGAILSIPSKFSVGLIVNVAQFSSESKVYNQKIDGGLGLGWRFSDKFSALASFEFTSIRQPRSFFTEQFRDKNIPLKVGENTTTSINFDDNNLFTNKYLPTFSLKAVLVLNSKSSPDTTVDEP